MTDVIEPVDTVEPGGAFASTRPPLAHLKLAAIDSSLWTVSRLVLILLLFVAAQILQGGLQRLAQVNALGEMEVKLREDIKTRQDEFAALQVSTKNVVKAVLALENAATYSPQVDTQSEENADLVDRLAARVDTLDQAFQARKQPLSDRLEATLPPLIQVSRRTVRSYRELANAPPDLRPGLENRLRAQIEQLKDYDDDFDVFSEEYQRELIARIRARKDELAHVGYEHRQPEADRTGKVR